MDQTEYSDRLYAYKKGVFRRLLVLYLALAFFVIAIFTYLQYDAYQSDQAAKAFQAQIVANCEANRANTQNFNDFIDQLITVVKQTESLSAADKELRIKFYTQAKSPVPPCPAAPAPKR